MLANDSSGCDAELVTFILSQSAMELESIMRQPPDGRHYSLKVKYTEPFFLLILTTVCWTSLIDALHLLIGF
jgi:hypothetical protein